MSEKRFDRWARTYDRSVAGWDDDPFVGYGDTLGRPAELADVHAGHRVLDVGIGTGTSQRGSCRPEGARFGASTTQVRGYARRSASCPMPYCCRTI